MNEFEEVYTECPVCGSIWGIDEIDTQTCFDCGYPNLETDFDQPTDED